MIFMALARNIPISEKYLQGFASPEKMAMLSFLPMDKVQRRRADILEAIEQDAVHATKFREQLDRLDECTHCER